MSLLRELTKGFWKENPLLVFVLGGCPTLAVTTTAENGFGMGLATTLVLLGSNTAVSIIRKLIPGDVRIPSFIIIAATFVTIIDLLMQAYTPALSAKLGIFIPLIVANCIILGRSEAFAAKNPIMRSALDGIGMGLGFTFALTWLAAIRELLGSGTIFGFPLFGEHYLPMIVMTLAPGAFLGLGFILYTVNRINAYNKARKA